MSGQWEVVGKKKDRSSKLPIAKTNNSKQDVKKKNAPNGVNIEEVLPHLQVQNLYAAKSNKENKKPQEKAKVVESNGKKVQKKVEKSPEQPKVKPPKSIESALNLIDVDDFKSFYEKIRIQYPADGQIIWLRELAQYLNQKIPIDVQDPVFPNKPVGYPFTIVPSALKSVIEKSVKDVGSNMSSVFFGIALTTMATDMSKGLPALGYKIYLQCIALNDSKLFADGINNNLITLLNSYQNRPNIGLSIIWAVGHSGVNNVSNGLKVFKEFMLPLLDMKNYSRYVVKYLLDLLNRMKDKTTLSKEEYLLIVDTAFSTKKNFPNDLRKDLSNKVCNLKSFLFKSNSDSYKGFFNLLFKRIELNSNKAYQDCLCEVLCEVFNREPSTLSLWDGIYKSNVAASAILLNYLSNNSTVVNSKINKDLTEVLKNFEAANEKLGLKKRKDEGLTESIAAIKKINEKMVSKKKGGFPLKTLMFLLVLMVGTTVYFDIKQHGSWKDSSLNKYMKESGICEYTHKALDKAKLGLVWADAKVEETFPGYHKKVADFSEPYVQLLKNLGLVIYNISLNVKDAVVEKYPIVVQSIEAYAPGVVEQSQKAVSNVWSASILYYNRSVDFLKKEVFVGQLSPENMQRVVLEAFNTTQQKATEYYHWLYEKVQTTIK